MSARLRKLRNDHASNTWDVSKLGFAAPIAAGGGELELTLSFTDAEIGDALQRGDLVLSTDNVLVVETPSGTKDITSVAAFGTYTQQQITDQTNSEHNHEGVDGGGKLDALAALTNISAAPAGTEQVLKTDASGNLAMGAGKISSSATSFSTTDLVNRGYVDSVAQGLDPKESVRVATTNTEADMDLNNPGTSVIDGITLNIGDRVLVKNQASSPEENGIYTFQGSGVQMTRTADFDEDADVTAGAFLFVAEGAENADSGWVLTSNDDIIIGTTALSFVQFSGAGQITAGVGMTKNGNILHVGSGVIEKRGGIDFQADDIAVTPKTNSTAADQYGGLRVNGTSGELEAVTDDSTLEVNASNQIQLKDDGVTGAKLAPAVAGDGLQQDASGNLNFDASDVAGDGLEDDGSENLKVKAYSGTDTSVAPVTVTTDGTGVDTDDDTIKHTAGVLRCDRAPSNGQKLILTFGRRSTVPGDTYLKSVNGIFGSVSTYRAIRAGKVTGMSVQCGTAPGTSVDFEVHKNGAVLDATVDVNLTGGAAGGEDDGASFANNTFAAGDLLSVYVTNLVGSSPSDVVALVEIELTA